MGDQTHEGGGEGEEGGVVILCWGLERGGGEGRRVDVWAHEEAVGEGEGVGGRDVGGADVEALGEVCELVMISVLWEGRKRGGKRKRAKGQRAKGLTNLLQIGFNTLPITLCRQHIIPPMPQLRLRIQFLLLLEGQGEERVCGGEDLALEGGRHAVACYLEKAGFGAGGADGGDDRGCLGGGGVGEVGGYVDCGD